MNAPPTPAATNEEKQELGRRRRLARAQLHATYVVAQTSDGIIIVDQHAAHERLTHERIRSAVETEGVSRQVLLVPEVVELESNAVDRLLERQAELVELGLVIDAFGPGAVVVRETQKVRHL